MAAGFQAWDADGNLIIDTGVRTVRIHGSRSTGTSAGSITIDTSQGTPFYQVFSLTQDNYARPVFTLSGNTLSWTAAQVSAFFTWGTF